MGPFGLVCVLVGPFDIGLIGPLIVVVPLVIVVIRSGPVRSVPLWFVPWFVKVRFVGLVCLTSL